MNIKMSATAASTLLLCAVLVTGCGNETPPPPAGNDAPAAQSFIGRQAAKGIAEAQRALETKNIGIGSNKQVHINGLTFGGDRAADDLPKAEITPRGALLIAGEELPATAQQRELLLDYRGHLIGLAQAGMSIGVQGADIAGTALTGIGQALFGGAEGRKAYEERIEAEADKIKHEAVKLCALLPALHDSQETLAAAMPEFAPYATLTREEVNECGEDADLDVDTGIAA